QAQSSLAVLYHRIRESELPADESAHNRETYMSRQIALLPGGQGFQTLQREMRTSLLLLFGATCVVLLILCANLANLMMARATVRASEMAVRLALGAGRWRLLRQWIIEGLVLSLCGGLTGIFVSMWIRAGLMFVIPTKASVNLNTSFGWRFAGFVFALSI